jgi:hypothetical protein
MEYQYQYQPWTPQLGYEIEQAFIFCRSIYDILDPYPDDPIPIEEVFNQMIDICQSFYSNHYHGFEQSFHRIIENREKLRKSLSDFINSKNLSFWQILRQVHSEQLMVQTINKQMLDICRNIYHVSLMYRNERMISMYISLLPQIREQIHFFIVKNVFYLFYSFIVKQQQLPNSSILLHSFASCIFGNDRWCTSPIGSMNDILTASGLVYRPMDMSERKKWEIFCSVWKPNNFDHPTGVCVERDATEKWKTFFIRPTPYQFTKDRIVDLVIYRPIQLTGGRHRSNH